MGQWPDYKPVSYYVNVVSEFKVLFFYLQIQPHVVNFSRIISIFGNFSIIYFYILNGF